MAQLPPGSASPISRPPSLFSAIFARILCVQMAFGLSYSAFLLLPKFLRVTYGASSTTIGWVSGTTVLSGAFFAPLVGSLCGNWSRRWVLGFGMACAGSAALAFGFVEHVGLNMYLLRALQGLAWAAVTNVTATMVADCVPLGRLSQSIGYLGLSMLVTNALAPAVTEPVAEKYGWTPVFIGAGILALLAFLAFPGLPSGAPDQQEAAAEESSVSFRLLSVHYASFLMGAGIGVMFTFTQPYALEQGATRLGDFFFGYVGAAVFVRVGLAHVADRVGPGKVAGYALALYAVVVLLTSGMRPSWLVPLGMGIGVSHGILYPALTAAGLSRLSASGRSRFLGWFSGAFNLGFAVALLGLGPVADRFGFVPVFLSVGAALASGVLPLIWTHRTLASASRALA